MKSCCGLQIPFTARPHFAVWPAKRSVLERAVCYLAACSDNNTVGVREFMGCNGIIHSLVRIGFVSSAYLGKDLKLLAVSLIQKNYLNVGIKRYGHLLLGFLKL